jgi:SAM-dependent methyltransferase
MSESSVGRPRRADVVARYDLGVDAYVSLWSPVILPPARAVVSALGLTSGAVVLDVGTGAGALVPHIRDAAGGATVVGVDPSSEMLGVARRSAGVLAVQGDAMCLPFLDCSFDAALLAFMLFHLDDPAVGLAEAARVVAVGGAIGAVTWARDNTIRAYEEWEATLTDAGVPPLVALRVDAGLDSESAIHALFAGAGLTSRVWSMELEQRWDPQTYWRLLTEGAGRLRLLHVDPSERERVLERARQRIAALPRDAFDWTGQVMCAVGRVTGDALKIRSSNQVTT